MTRRRRHGRRLLVVLSRLAVVGLLTLEPPINTGPTPAVAQSEPGGPPQPPPPQQNPRPPDPPHAESLPKHPGQPPSSTQTAPVADDGADPFEISLPTPPSLERLTVRRNSLNQVLYKDRRHQQLLLRGDNALSQGDTDSALLVFQTLAESEYDAFFWQDDFGQPGGAHVQTQSRLRMLPPTDRETYEQLHGGEAAAILAKSNGSADSRLLQTLLKRFPRTVAARKTIVVELLRAHDAGQRIRASELAHRLNGDPWHRNQLSTRVRALVHQLTTGTVGTTPVREHTASSPPALRPVWVYPLIDSARHPISSTLSAVPEAELVAPIRSAVEEWVTERRDRRLPVSTANFSCAYDDVLIVRDYGGIQAIDLATGQKTWRFDCAHSLVASAASQLQQRSQGAGVAPLNFHTLFAGDGQSGGISSDGHQIYLVDEAVSLPDANRDDAASTESLTNRLIALPLHAEEPYVEPAWQLPGPAASGLSRCYFLGPPLVVEGRLFVLAESEGRVECLALDPVDGRLVWRQPIALTEQPIEWDASRLRVACSPLYAEGTVVCPTELGVVGVDPLTGSLRWVYDHIDDDQRLAAGRWSSSSQRNFGSAELPSRTLIHQGRVLHLPFRSRYVHCIDAATGSRLWRTERQQALALSAATDEMVLMIGPRDVTALALSDGSLQWKSSCPEPAGHGVIAGNEYLLPMIDGRCIALSLDDGRTSRSGFGKLLRDVADEETVVPRSDEGTVQLVSHEVPSADPAHNPWQADGGHFCVAGNSIVVTTPRQVAVFPQARPLVDSLRSQSVVLPLGDEDQLHVAMLNMLLGDVPAAQADLENLLPTTRQGDPRIDLTVTQARAVRLLRELLFADLRNSGDPLPIIDRLARLPGTSKDHLRLLICRIDAAVRRGDADELIAAVHDLRRVESGLVIAPQGDTGFQVRACDQIESRLTDIYEARESEEVHSDLYAVLSSCLEDLLEEAIRQNDLRQQRQLLRLFDGWPQVGRLRNDVAQAAIDRGELQRAELLLLRNRSVAEAHEQGRSRRLLAELYWSKGLIHEAATMLAELAEGFSTADVGGMTGQEFVGQFSYDHPLQRVVRRRQCKPDPVYRVAIREHLCSDDCASPSVCGSIRAAEHHDRIRRKFLARNDASVTIIDRGIVSSDRSHSSLALVNRETGELHGELNVPAAYWQLPAAGEGCCGQLLPICGRSAHGLSLLEQRPLWSTGRDEIEQRDRVRVGPVGHEYCVVQTSRTLSVLHPATGECRWSRDDLPPDTGLLANESTGIIGDDRTLTVFGADQLSYTVYHMRSGQQLRRGKLDVSLSDTRKYRRAAGAKLISLVGDSLRTRFQLWDSATDRVIADIPLWSRLCVSMGGGEFACVDEEGELSIINAHNGQVTLRTPLSPADLADVSEISVASGPDHHYINLGRSEENSDVVAAMDEVELPTLRVSGTLLAISNSGRRLWKQEVPDAALLTQSQARMPVFALISRVRDSQQRHSARLQIEVRDVRTGEVLARRSDLQRTRIVHSEFQPENGRLRLVGLDSQIDLEFGPTPSDLLIHAEVETESLVR